MTVTTPAAAEGLQRRRSIVRILEPEPLSLEELTKAVGDLSANGVKRHLLMLADADVVERVHLARQDERRRRVVWRLTGRQQRPGSRGLLAKGTKLI